jgi:hypothetical protein
MKLDAARFGIAAAAAAAVLWLALALFVMLLPGATMGGAGAMLKQQKNGGQDHEHDKCGAGPRFQKGSHFALTLHSASRQTCPWRVRSHTRPGWHGEKFDGSELARGRPEVIAVPKLIPY